MLVQDTFKNLGPRLRRAPAFLFVAYGSSESKVETLVTDYEGLLSRIRFDKR